MATNLELVFVALMIVSAVPTIAATWVSTYPLVAPSVVSVGVARFTILCELRLTLPVGAVMLSSVVVAA